MVFDDQSVERPGSGGQGHENGEKTVEAIVAGTVEADQCRVFSEEEFLFARVAWGIGALVGVGHACVPPLRISFQNISMGPAAWGSFRSRIASMTAGAQSRDALTTKDRRSSDKGKLVL